MSVPRQHVDAVCEIFTFVPRQCIAAACEIFMSIPRQYIAIASEILSHHTQYGRDTKFTVCFSFFLSDCTVIDFSAGALPIGVKFCMAIRPYLRQDFSYFGG